MRPCVHPPERVFYEADNYHCEVCGACRKDWSRVRRALGFVPMLLNDGWGPPLPAGSYIAQRLR